MNEEKLISFLQTHVDYPIDKDLIEQIKTIGGLDITSENALLILEEVRKQNSISRHLRNQGDSFKIDENTFIAKTLKSIEKQENKKTLNNIFWNGRTLALGLSLCFGLLLFFPVFQNTMSDDPQRNQHIDSYMLDSLQPVYSVSKPESTDILQYENFGSDRVTIFLTSQLACANC